MPDIFYKGLAITALLVFALLLLLSWFIWDRKFRALNEDGEPCRWRQGAVIKTGRVCGIENGMLVIADCRMGNKRRLVHPKHLI